MQVTILLDYRNDNLPKNLAGDGVMILRLLGTVCSHLHFAMTTKTLVNDFMKVCLSLLWRHTV